VSLNKIIIPVLASVLILGTLTANPFAFSDHQPLEIIEFTDGDLSCTMTTFEGGGHFDILPDLPGMTFAPTVFPSGSADTWRTITSGGYSNNPSPPTALTATGPPQIIPRDVLFDEPVSKISFFHTSPVVDLTVNVYDINDNLLESNTYPATPDFSVFDFITIDVGGNEISRAEFLILSLQHAIDDFTYCIGPDVPTFDSLREQILSLDLPDGLTNALVSKVDAAEQQFENGNNDAAANILDAFINQVEAQTGKKIDVADAAELVVVGSKVKEVIK